MALIKCDECGKEISDTAKSCPNCGYSIKQSFDLKKFIKGKEKIIIGLIIFIIIIFIVITFISNTEQNKLKKYLTNNGFTCSQDTYKVEQEDITGTYCKKGNYVYLVDVDYNLRLFYLYSNTSYILMDRSVYYLNNPIIFYSDDEIMCTFKQNDRNVNIGSKFDFNTSYDEETESYCIGKVELVNEVAREFEKTFDGAKLEIQTQ